MVPPHISTYQQYQYQNVQPTGTITAAPTVYKATGATPAAQTGKTISSEPQLKKPKGKGNLRMGDIGLLRGDLCVG